MQSSASEFLDNIQKAWCRKISRERGYVFSNLLLVEYCRGKLLQGGIMPESEMGNT